MNSVDRGKPREARHAEQGHVKARLGMVDDRRHGDPGASIEIPFVRSRIRAPGRTGETARETAPSGSVGAFGRRAQFQDSRCLRCARLADPVHYERRGSARLQDGPSPDRRPRGGVSFGRQALRQQQSGGRGRSRGSLQLPGRRYFFNRLRISAKRTSEVLGRSGHPHLDHAEEAGGDDEEVDDRLDKGPVLQLHWDRLGRIFRILHRAG